MYKLVSVAEHQHDLYYNHCFIKSYRSKEEAREAMSTLGETALKNARQYKRARSRRRKPLI